MHLPPFRLLPGPRLGARLTLLVIAIATAAVLPGAELRQVINLNREWSFQLGDHAGADAPSFDDSSWQRVGLPHSFSIPYFAAGNAFYVGYGWYRKHLTVPAEWRGKRLFLEFDGAFQDAEVFLNGRRVGAHQGGYTGFQIEITDAAVTGSNLLAVRLNNHWNPRLAPRAGEHTFSGGLYRNVRLVVTDPLHVTWYGTFVTTPSVSAAAGIVNVKTEVVNQSAAGTSCTVQTDVIDPDGRRVARLRSTQPVPAGSIVTFDQTSEPIAQSRLWSPREPHLYAVRTTVFSGDQPVDDFTSPLGFRWFQFTADRGFFLNGEHFYFKGANVHQDHAGWGDAVTESGFFRDVQLIKEAGFDFIRGSHYPHAPAFSAACDQIGMLFMSENCFWGTAGFKSPWGASAYPTDPADEADFEASARASLHDMIRIHRNHPSILLWSTGNEVFFSDRTVMPKVRSFLQALVAYARELDPTRPIAVGGSQRGEIDKLADVAAYNGDGARLFPDPGIPNLVSEYGSTMTDRPGEYAPGWGDLPATPGAPVDQPYAWRLPWRSGEAIWCGFDHGSIAGRQFGAMGMIDYFRLPKRQWYWYRNAYRNVPPPRWPVHGIPAALALTADKTILRSVDGTDDAHLIVTVLDREGGRLSNSPPVTLTIESGPGEFPTGPSITFAADSDIAIRDGAAAIEFRSYHAGETVIRATSPGLQDATIRISSQGEPRFSAGVTPATQPRPYARFVNPLAAGETSTFGMDNPTRASSEAPEHSARLANDGYAATFWQPRPDDPAPWLIVDLERVVTPHQVRLTFPNSGRCERRLEISEDGQQNWRTLVEDSGEVVSGREHTTQIDRKDVSGRFVRITLTRRPTDRFIGLSELTVVGSLAPDRPAGSR